RTPMQWDASSYAGFSTVESWLPVNPDHWERNVKRQAQDPHSMLNLVKSLLRLRRESPALVAGAYETVAAPEGVYAYFRATAEERILVALNFTPKPRILRATGGRVLVSTHLDRNGSEVGPLLLRENEGIVLRLSR
ncbi:MAG: DUF3459 domain-containing protein, partial [Chloroflexi bacterium]|nr:DUF3459 domain-containing protein [Chloroflexota bacterium]